MDQSSTKGQIYYRSRRYKTIAGICSGIALTNGWSITLVRMAMLLLFATTGLGLVVYLLAWIFMPVNPDESLTSDLDLASVDPLRRSNTSKILGGVCGGLAEFFHVDAGLIRVLACVLVLFCGIGLLPYLYAWIVLPKKTA